MLEEKLKFLHESMSKSVKEQGDHIGQLEREFNKLTQEITRKSYEMADQEKELQKLDKHNETIKG